MLFEEKLKLFWKNSRVLTPKLNDTVVADYTLLPKNVKKTKPGLDAHKKTLKHLILQ